MSVRLNCASAKKEKNSNIPAGCTFSMFLLSFSIKGDLELHLKA
jgi:hypothetical protein